MALKRLCPHCNKLIEYSSKYCKECENKVKQSNKERYKTYSKNRDDKDIQRIYTSKRWQQVRELAQIQQFGLDLYEYYINNKIVVADTYHHIVETKEDISRAFDIENVFGLTDSNHRIIHEKYIKSDEYKKEMQDLLFSLLKRFKEEFY